MLTFGSGVAFNGWPYVPGLRLPATLPVAQFPRRAARRLGARLHYVVGVGLASSDSTVVLLAKVETEVERRCPRSALLGVGQSGKPLLLRCVLRVINLVQRRQGHGSPRD